MRSRAMNEDSSGISSETTDLEFSPEGDEDVYNEMFSLMTSIQNIVLRKGIFELLDRAVCGLVMIFSCVNDRKSARRFFRSRELFVLLTVVATFVSMKSTSAFKKQYHRPFNAKATNIHRKTIFERVQLYSSIRDDDKATTQRITTMLTKVAKIVTTKNEKPSNGTYESAEQATNKSEALKPLRIAFSSSHRYVTKSTVSDIMLTCMYLCTVK